MTEEEGFLGTAACLGMTLILFAPVKRGVVRPPNHLDSRPIEWNDIIRAYFFLD